MPFSLQSFDTLTLILPTLNEEKQIAQTLEIIYRHCPGAYALVVDDGSRDNTLPIVQELGSRNSDIRLIDRKSEPVKGLTQSVIVGIQATRTPFFVVLDADLQHPPEKIPELYSLLSNGADLVIGQREKVLVPWPFQRRLISKSATALAEMRLLFKGFGVRDPMSGFFGGKTVLAQDIIQRNLNRFEPKGYKILFELLKFLPRSSKVKKVSYNFGLRKGGESKIATRHFYCFLRSLLK